MNIDRESLIPIEEMGKTPAVDDNGPDELHSLLRVAIPIFAVIVATAVLYFARDILLPLAMATMLSVIFSPLARRAENVIGHSRRNCAGGTGRDRDGGRDRLFPHYRT